MPIYEYRCKKCGHIFELGRPYGQMHAPAPCPECGGASDKLMSGLVRRSATS